MTFNRRITCFTACLRWLTSSFTRTCRADPLPADLGQYDEMAEVPVQDAWGCEPGKIIQIQSERTGLKAHHVGNADEMGEIGSLQRQRVALSQFSQAGLLAVVAGHHGRQAKPHSATSDWGIR